MLSPGQMGVLATFAPPMKGFVINNAVLLRLRRSFHIVLSKLNTEGLSDDVYDGYSNLLCCLPFMFLQYDGQNPSFEKCDMFYTKLRDGDVMSIKVGDFAKKSLKSHRLIQRKYDFKSRRSREADRNVRAGDYGKAMQALLKVDAKVNLEGVEDVIMESLPPRVFSNLNEVQRNDLFTYVDNPGSSEFISESVVLQQLRRLKRNRSPDVDGMTVEHLNSIFLGGGRDEVGKKEVLKEYVTFLSRWYECRLTDNQRRLFHALKLAVIPKNEQESRVIMMSGIHSKIVFSSFAASKLKRKIEKEGLKNQYGSKPAGAEAMIHIFQQLRESNPDFDIFSADAVKAFYNLNRDLTMMKLKEQAPQVFNLFMDKYNNSSDAFFFGLAQGVARFTQSEGGSPGSPEMNFLYELGISDFVQNVADLLHESEGVVAGYIDDLYWSAPFDKMIEVIRFVMVRGPAYGYNLNMKKSVYLMAPLGRDISQRDLDVRIRALTNLGIPVDNIKIHPDCQSFASLSVLVKRRVEFE